MRGDTWFWLAGPKNLPADIVHTGSMQKMRRINKTPKMQEHFKQSALLTKDLDPPAWPNSSPTNTPSGRPVAKEAGLTVQ